jgi:hypothetical protein
VAKVKSANNALLEGGDVAVEAEQPLARIPVTFSEVYARLDRELRLHERALLRAPQPRTSALEPAAFWVFEAQVRDNGKVCLIDDLVSRARELGCLEEFETPIPIWG